MGREGDVLADDLDVSHVEPGTLVAALRVRHRAGIDERRRDGNEPNPAEPTLQGLAEAIAEFLTRLMAQVIRTPPAADSLQTRRLGWTDHDIGRIDGQS
jgi:hypothetical protein